MAQSLFEELKRRNVFKATTAYLVLAWVVIQVTAEAVPALGLPEYVNTLVFFLGAVGLPFVILFSWAFELTPEGVKKESEVDRSESITSNTGQKLNYVIIILLVSAIGLMLFGKGSVNVSQTTDATHASENSVDAQNLKASIAVLPFMNMSNDAEQEFFSDGITEELLNVLAKIATLEVASRTSSFKYKETKEKIPEIAKDLNVRYVVEGSVRRAGKTIRITAQLIDSTNDRHLWSDTFDRPLTADNIFVIQDEISQNIVTALSKELGLNEVIQIQTKHTTDNLTAYELYLKARAIQQTRLNLDEAERLLGEALEQDPDYADALGLAAVNYALLAIYGTELSLTPDKLIEKSVAYAKRAIELDENSANAYAVLGLNLHYFGARGEKVQWTEVFSYYEKAISLNPNNPQALNWLAVGKMYLGFLDESRPLLEQCITAEPSYSSCHANLIGLEAAQGNDQLAVDLFESVLDMGGLDILRYAPVHSFARLEMPLAFKSYSTSEFAFKGWAGQEQLMMAHKNPEKDHSELLASLLAHLKTMEVTDGFKFDDLTVLQGRLLIPLGHHETFVGQYSWDSSYKGYRQSKIFKETLLNLGALEYWKTIGFPKSCKALGDDDFVCD